MMGWAKINFRRKERQSGIRRQIRIGHHTELGARATVSLNAVNTLVGSARLLQLIAVRIA